MRHHSCRRNTPRSAWTNPQPYAPVDLIAGLSGAAALIVGVRLPQVRPMLRSWPALWLALGGIILIVAAARYGRASNR